MLIKLIALLTPVARTSEFGGHCPGCSATDRMYGIPKLRITKHLYLWRCGRCGANYQA